MSWEISEADLMRNPESLDLVMYVHKVRRDFQGGERRKVLRATFYKRYQECFGAGKIPKLLKNFLDGKYIEGKKSNPTFWEELDIDPDNITEDDLIDLRDAIRLWYGHELARFGS